MVKLNKITQARLMLEAEEAEERGLNKLSEAVVHLLKVAKEKKSEENEEEYSYDDMNKEIYQSFWELASCVAKYYDIQDFSAEKLNPVIESIADEFVEEIERVLGVDEIIGPLEPKTPGEK